jgi:transposase
MPVRFILTGGQRNDITRADALIDGLLLADPAYDADHLRDGVIARKAHMVIPSHPSRAQKRPLDKDIYKERHLVESCFDRGWGRWVNVHGDFLTLPGDGPRHRRARDRPHDRRSPRSLRRMQVPMREQRA